MEGLQSIVSSNGNRVQLVCLNQKIYKSLTIFVISLFAGDSAAQLDLSNEQRIEFENGKKIYVEQCLGCHGDQGQGSVHFEAPLTGDLSIAALSKLIDDTMPEHEPHLCRAKDAKAVATYIYSQFYSETSALRIGKSRVELQRRTIRQYRQAVADLIGSFSENQQIRNMQRGLKAQYFAWDKYREDRRLSTQIDSNIDYPAERGGVQHFRADNKYEGVKEVKRANEMGKGFCIYWTGGLIVDRTGEYEILVRCPNGFKLFINDKAEPVVDQWVRSNDDLEHRAKIYLVEGRNYYFHLHLFAYKDKAVSAQLLWQPPGRPMQVIPSSAFVTEQPAEVNVVSTAFPADDASRGYERGNSVSRQWDVATTNAAIQTANWVSNRIEHLSGTAASFEERKDKTMAFCRQFVERAFVNELNNEEYEFFVDQHFDNELSLKDQVKRVVLLTLKSPRFLYPELASRNQSSRNAERMARILWDSLPDNQLMQAVENDDLLDKGAIDRELSRMLNDYRTGNKLKRFLADWLKLDSFGEVGKDSDRFPDFDARIMDDMRTSLELQLDELVWQGSADYRQLFLSEKIFFNSRLADFFGFEDVAFVVDQFKPVEFESDSRIGILTHPFLLTGLAYHQTSSPIHRGVFVARNLMGRRLRQPPDEVEPLSEDFDNNMTTRELVEHQTKELSCMNCHQIINPLGFSLENFDAVGRFRESDNDKPVNAVSNYTLADGNRLRLNGPSNLAQFLANDEHSQRHFIRQMFHYFTKQSIYAYGPDTLDLLHERFVDSNCNIKSLLIEIAKVVIEYKQPHFSQ